MSNKLLVEKLLADIGDILGQEIPNLHDPYIQYYCTVWLWTLAFIKHIILERDAWRSWLPEVLNINSMCMRNIWSTPSILNVTPAFCIHIK